MSRRIVKALLAGVAVGLVTLTGAMTSAAAGTWGSGDWPYEIGTICNVDPSTTAPLAAWNTGPEAPAFLTSPITTANGLAPPLPSVGSQTRGTVAPEPLAFASSAQIGATAYLIGQWGRSTDPRRVAEVAELVMAAAGDSTLSGCLGQDGLSSTAAVSMWTDAQRFAGPYHVAVVDDPPTQSVVATVTTASGVPVPGLAVTFTAPDAAVSTTATITDSSGQATSTVTTPSASGSTVVTATVSASIGLSDVSVPGAATAVAAAPPAAVSASATVVSDLVANPAITTATTTLVSALGTSVTAEASVTGMANHQGSATLTVDGPLPLDAVGSCSSITADTWTRALAADTAGTLVVARVTQAFTGDPPVITVAFAPEAAGCYTTSATATTTDATPNLSATAAPGSALGSLTALAAVLGIRSTGGVIGPGPVHLVVDLAGTAGASTVLTGSVLGPASPAAGSCADLSWKQVPSAATVPPASTSTDGAFTLTSGTLATYGCYAITVTAAIAAGSGSAHVLHVVSNVTELLLTPTVEAWDDTTWVLTNDSAHATVHVYGSLTQPAHLQSELRWLPPQRLGCATADYSAAAVIAHGASIPTTGDGTYHLVAPRATKAGCYTFVPVLTLTANTGVQVAGTTGFAASIFSAGADGPVTQAIGEPVKPEHDTTRLWVTGAVFAVFVLAAVGRVSVLAWRDEKGPGRHAAIA